jgi:hypothetical protein
MQIADCRLGSPETEHSAIFNLKCFAPPGAHPTGFGHLAQLPAGLILQSLHH